MIRERTVSEAMYEAVRRAAIEMPPDVRNALEKARDAETDPVARLHLEVSLENADLAHRGEGLVCADTGFPLFFVQVRRETRVEGGFKALQRAAEIATARATEDCFLRPTMVDPLRRSNPGNNIGPGMPHVDLTFQGDGAGLDIVAAPKGGGSEIFGTFYRMLFPSDGMAGVKKFVIESLRCSCYAGKICPPAIVGVGIGGTADVCMRLAKKAAVLRKIGARHPDPLVSEMEGDLFRAALKLGIGPMGARGRSAVIAMNIETAVTHTAALPVAFNAQCLVGRRWSAHISPDESITYSGDVV